MVAHALDTMCDSGLKYRPASILSQLHNCCASKRSQVIGARIGERSLSPLYGLDVCLHERARRKHVQLSLPCTAARTGEAVEMASAEFVSLHTRVSEEPGPRAGRSREWEGIANQQMGV